MSAARAASYLVDEGPVRRQVAVLLARGIVADERSESGEILEASAVLRRAGLDDEASAAAARAAAQ